MSVSAATTTAAARAGLRGRIVTVVLGLIGAALVAAGVWLPWGTGTYTTLVGGQSQTMAVRISAGDVAGVLSLAPWSAVTVVGVPLCCLLVLRGPRWLRLLAKLCFLLWALAALAVVTPTLVTLLTANPVQIRDIQGISQVTVTHALQPAMILTYLGLLLAEVAAVLSLLDRHGSRESRPIALYEPAGRKLPASGALVLSALLFLVSVFAMPWATVNCTQTPLFIGQCTGVSYAGAASAGIHAYATNFDPLAARYAIPILLAGGALFLLLGVWRRDLFRAGGAWLVLWLLTATLFAVLGDAGIGAIVANPAAYSLPAGRWSGDIGIVIAFLGLLVGWLATLYLGIVSLLRR